MHFLSITTTGPSTVVFLQYNSDVSDSGVLLTCDQFLVIFSIHLLDRSQRLHLFVPGM